MFTLARRPVPVVLPSALRYSCPDPPSRRPMQQQPMQSHRLRCNRLQLNQRQPPLCDLPPPINSRLALHHFSPIQIPQKLSRIRNRRCFPITGPRQGFHRVTPQQFAPIMFEQIARRKNVAPGHLTAIGHHNAHHAFSLQSQESSRSNRLRNSSTNSSAEAPARLCS